LGGAPSLHDRAHSSQWGKPEDNANALSLLR
jgi:hypothetical protein